MRLHTTEHKSPDLGPKYSEYQNSGHYSDLRLVNRSSSVSAIYSSKGCQAKKKRAHFMVPQRIFHTKVNHKLPNTGNCGSVKPILRRSANTRSLKAAIPGK